MRRWIPYSLAVVALIGGVVRNMMATADGKLVLACSAVNRVALVDIGH